MYRARARIEESNFPAYARRTILNLLRSGLRRRAVERRVLQQLRAERPPAGVDPDSSIDVRRALLMLSVSDRASLALRHFENRSDAEIAEVLGVSGSAAKKRMQRAQQRLRALLSEEES
jgi:RNA polymerase sigma factor (sigma-70 family)